MTEQHDGQPLELDLAGPVQANMGPNNWTVVALEGSATALDTAKAVKVAGTLDGHEFSATLLPLGAGTHMLPLNAKLRKLVDKAEGETVAVHLSRRFP